MVAFRTSGGAGTEHSDQRIAEVAVRPARRVGSPVHRHELYFATGETVTFGATAAAGVVRQVVRISRRNSGSCASAATVTVTVGTPGGSPVQRSSYVGTPTVTSVSPNTGSTAGGTAVTITGTNFASGATVGLAPRRQRAWWW